MDKSRIRERLVALEAAELQESRDAYNQYVAGARVDTGGGVIDDQDGSQAAQSRNLAEAFDCPLHDQVHKLDLIERIDFGPKSKVEPGAVVKLDGRYFVIGVASGVFDYDGQSFMGLSPEAPIYAVLEDREAGETFTFRGHAHTVEEVA
jgi:hypothetical protein